MSKLHQLIAVEADLDRTRKAIAKETTNNFREKQNLFEGFIKTLAWFKDGEPEYPAESQTMTDTVTDQLNYWWATEATYLDALAQKDSTNQIAKAPLVVDGVDIGTFPATFLLSLESKLVTLKEVLQFIPTLKVGIEWKPAPDKGPEVWAAQPEETLRTAKKFKYQVLVEPTQHHPAQVEKWEDQVPVGKFTKLRWSSAWTSARKAALLGRLDKLIIATKKARQVANEAEVVDVHVAPAIWNYLMGQTQTQP